MDTNIIIILVLSVCSAVFVGAGIFVTISYNKNWDMEKIFGSVDKAVDVAKQIDEILGGFLPVNIDNLIDKILFYAESAVHSAEQLYKIGQAKAEERKALAMEFVTQALALQSIEVTDDLKKFIDMAIEASVFVLKKIPLTEEVKQ